MHLKLFGKIYLVILSSGLFALFALSLVVYMYGVRYQAHIEEMNNEVVAYAEAETAHVFRDAARTRICAAADAAAEGAEEYFERKQSVLATLSTDAAFASATAEIVFGRGTSGIVEPKERLVISHPRADLVGKRLPDLSEYSDPSFGALWNLFDESVGLDEASGSYMKADADGVRHEHIVCFVRVPLLTKDNVRLVAFATAYREDLGITGGMLSSALRQKYGAATADAMNTLRDMRNFLGLALVILFLTTFLIAWLFARSVTRPLSALTAVCEKIAEGKLDVTVPPCKKNDEIADLSHSIARMQKSLTDQAALIAEQNRNAEERTKDLKEALRIAEERTKQVLGIQQK